jgi:DinB superfamily
MSELARPLLAAIDDAERLWSEVSPERLAQRPRARSWSAVECVEHLNISLRVFLPRLQDAVARARQLPAASGEAMKLTGMARWLAWSLEPPSRLRLPASKPFVPVEYASTRFRSVRRSQRMRSTAPTPPFE